MRHLAIGDIHGCYRALTTLIDAVAPSSDDVVITLGDYVDRGPDTRRVVDWLIDYSQGAKLITLKGNHEAMMLAARDDKPSFSRWLMAGGGAVLESYDCELAEVPDDHWEFLENLSLWHEIDSHFFVHANAEPNTPLDEQPTYMLIWESLNRPRPHTSGKTMICGHTCQYSGVPLDLGFTVCIDTAACKGGWLTCLDIASGDYWQANQQGAVRQSRLKSSPPFGLRSGDR